MSVAAPIDRPVRGIVLMATAVLSLSVMGILVKVLTVDYPTAQLIWARFFFNFLLVLGLLLTEEQKGP